MNLALKLEYEEWLRDECSCKYTNEEFIDIFIKKIIKWLKRQNETNVYETRELKLSMSKTQFKKEIYKIIFNFR